MADLSTFRRFVETSSAFASSNIPEVKHVAEETWEYKGEEFTTPGSDSRLSAGWYALYMRRCAKKGVEPGPYELPEDDE